MGQIKENLGGNIREMGERVARGIADSERAIRRSRELQLQTEHIVATKMQMVQVIAVDIAKLESASHDVVRRAEQAQAFHKTGAASLKRGCRFGHWS
jgi:hypothetical protein